MVQNAPERRFSFFFHGAMSGVKKLLQKNFKMLFKKLYPLIMKYLLTQLYLWFITFLLLKKWINRQFEKIFLFCVLFLFVLCFLYISIVYIFLYFIKYSNQSHNFLKKELHVL